MVLVYTVCQDMEQAKDLGRKILKARVAACVNMWPIESAYFEGENVKEGMEAALLIKTNEPKVAEIEEFLSKYHTYSVPYIGMIDVRRLNRDYKEWMSTVMR